MTARPILRRLTVMQLVDATGRGGAERMLVDLALGLDRDRFDVSVCATRHALEYQPLLDAAGVPTLVLGRRSRWDFRRLARLVRVLRDRPVHIVHSHLFGSNTWGRLLGKMAGVPVIIAHEHWSSRSRTEIAIDRLLYRLSDAIVVASDESKRLMMELEGIPSRRLTVIRNGVDPAPFDTHAVDDARPEFGIAPGETVFGTVARLDPFKGGQDDLLRAFARLRSARPDTRLLVIGDGPQRPELQALAGSLGLGDAALFTGTRGDIPRLLRAMDVFVLPSRREALPLAILEAMAAGLPVVATRVGGVPETIEDNATGLLVPAGDSEALGAGLARLADAPELRARLGLAGRAHFRAGFTVHHMVRAVEALYDELAHRKLPGWVRRGGG